MSKVKEAFKITLEGLNSTSDIIAVKTLQLVVYQDKGWVEEAERIVKDIDKMKEDLRSSSDCTCLHGTIIFGGTNHGTCGECGKPTTDE